MTSKRVGGVVTKQQGLKLGPLFWKNNGLASHNDNIWH